jgi:hypothetical protein
MKTLNFFFALVLFSSVLFGQKETIPDKQFMLWCSNVGSSEEITHYINATGEVWQWNGSTFVTGGIYSSSLVTVGNADFGSNDWPGFNFNWFLAEPHWSLGLYKVTNSKQTDKYFYLDARDSDFGEASYNPDFYIYFDNGDSVYKYKNTGNAIPQGTLVSVWQIHEETPNTSGLQNYWSNVLVLVNDGSNHPRLIWGPFPNTDFIVSYYKIYKKKNSQNFEFYDTSNSPEYVDTDETLLTGPPQANETVAKYRVTAVGYLSESQNETNPSNEVEARVPGDPPQKKGHSFNLQPSEFSLNQNYPNPFNPVTVITYSIPENSFISLKVYDVLGNEIIELINEAKESGNYSVSFDASGLSSGIYFYTLKANSFSLTKKMLLAK